MSYVVLGSLWSVYLIIHSVLASNAVKKWSERKLKLDGAGYRQAYTVISILGLGGIVYILYALPEKHLFDPSVTRYFGAIMILPGFWILYLSFRFFSAREFVGLKQADTESELIRKGIHARVRHPIYTGTILLLLGYFLINPTDLMLTSMLVIFVYLPIGIYFEEKKLIKKFGEDYLAYKREIPSILPTWK